MIEESTNTNEWNLESAAKILWETGVDHDLWARVSNSLHGIALFLTGYDRECAEDAGLLADIAMQHEMDKRGRH